MRAWAYGTSRTANSEATCLVRDWLLGNWLGKLHEAHFNLDMQMLHRASEITVCLAGVTYVHVHVYTKLTKVFAPFITQTKS